MKFLSLRAQNFMSFKEFDLIFPPSGLIFVGGKVVGGGMSNSNGAGKSAIFEALCWGMYGQSLRSTGKDDVVNYKMKRNCFVEVIFESDLGTPYIVTRYRNHKEFGNSFTLFQGDKDVTASDSKATQDTINNLIKMNWLVFSTAVVFGEKAQRFAEAKDSEKKEIFDEILMFQDYQNALKAVKEDVQAGKVLVDSLKGKLDVAQGRADTALKQLEQAHASYEDWKIKKAAHATAMQSLCDEAEALKIPLQGMVNELKVLDQAALEANSAIPPADKLYQSREQTRIKVIGEFNPLIIKYSSKINIVENDIAQVSRAQTGKGIGTRCPTCYQPITNESSNEVIAHFAAEKSRLVKELEEAKAEYQVVVNEKKSVEKEQAALVNEAQVAVHELRMIFDKKTSKATPLRQRVIDAQNKIDSLANAAERLGEIGSASSYIEAIERIETAVSQHVVEAESAQNDLAAVESNLRYLNFWVEGFGNRGIKSFLLDDIIPALTARANYYASVLMDGESQITFSTESTLKSGDVRDKFDIKLVISGQTVDYKTLSSGEKRRVDVAILLALQSLVFERSAGSCNVIAFDEVFDSLDITGIEKTIGLLAEEAQQKTIFVISHSQEFSDYFDNVIVVEKKNGVSILKTDND